MSSPPRLEPGTVLDGKWTVEGVLGEGGMGSVYRATHVRNGLSVALKVLHPDLARDKQLRERFLHEGYAANKVGHPGTVRVLDDGQTPDDLVFLVMELLIGETVEALAQGKGGAISLAEVLPILDSTLETLAAAHAVGTVHRDIKPENLFLTREGVLKVLDFGLARVKEATTQARLTVAGVPMGTPAFMPPEQALAKWDEVTTRSDVYSVGASVWNLLTGHLVHDGSNVPQLLVAVSTQPARPIRTVAPGLPIAFASVIDRALAFSPADRWADAGEMLLALRGAVGRRDQGPRSQSSAALGYAATLQVPELSQSVDRALRVVGPGGPVMTEPPAATRGITRGTLPSIPSVRSSDARPGVSTGTGTVAPVSSDPNAIRRKRSSAVLVAVAGTVILVGTTAAAALFYAHEKRIGVTSTPASSLEQNGEGATHYTPTTSETPVATAGGPLITPSPTASVADSATPPTVNSAVATKPSKPQTSKSGPKTTKQTPVDPLGKYR